MNAVIGAVIKSCHFDLIFFSIKLIMNPKMINDVSKMKNDVLGKFFSNQCLICVLRFCIIEKNDLEENITTQCDFKYIYISKGNYKQQQKSFINKLPYIYI